MKHLNDAHNKSLVDRVVKNKGVLSFMIHTVGEGDRLTEAEFKSVADYVKSKVDAGLLEVITFEDIVKGQ